MYIINQRVRSINFYSSMIDPSLDGALAVKAIIESSKADGLALTTREAKAVFDAWKKHYPGEGYDVTTICAEVRYSLDPFIEYSESMP